MASPHRIEQGLNHVSIATILDPTRHVIERVSVACGIEPVVVFTCGWGEPAETVLQLCPCVRTRVEARGRLDDGHNPLGLSLAVTTCSVLAREQCPLNEERLCLLRRPPSAQRLCLQATRQIQGRNMHTVARGEPPNESGFAVLPDSIVSCGSNRRIASFIEGPGRLQSIPRRRDLLDLRIAWVSGVSSAEVVKGA